MPQTSLRQREWRMAASFVVIDLGVGRSWYPTRLFALAAAADELNGARAIVVLAQRGGVAGRFSGWITPRDVVTAYCERDPRYRGALNEARAILHHLRLSGGNMNYVWSQPSFDGTSSSAHIPRRAISPSCRP